MFSPALTGAHDGVDRSPSPSELTRKPDTSIGVRDPEDGFGRAAILGKLASRNQLLYRLIKIQQPQTAGDHGGGAPEVS
jgi:hypothetical protein